MLTIPRIHSEEMITHALEEDPDECCGILAGSGDSVEHVYRIRNSKKSPYLYVMDPGDQLNAQIDADRNGWDTLAYYHSHTHSAAYPSATDVRMATQLWDPNNTYILLSLENKENPQTRGFHIREDGEIDEVEIDIGE